MYVWKNICVRYGFQTRSIERYIRELKNLNKSFVIYNYDKDLQKEDEIIRFQSEDIFEDKKCLQCENCNNKKETVEEIIERVKNSAKWQKTRK